MTRSRSRKIPRNGKPARAGSRLRQICVFTEGEATEPDYVNHWYREYRQRVNVVIDEFHGGPVQLVDRAIERRKRDQREARRGRGEAFDQTAFIHRHDAQRISKELLGCGKRLTPDALSRLQAAFASAETRARALDEKHRLDGSAPRSNPSSAVWRLIEAIVRD